MLQLCCKMQHENLVPPGCLCMPGFCFDCSGCVKCGNEHQGALATRLRLALWLRLDGLVDLPQVAFGIGKVCRA